MSDICVSSTRQTLAGYVDYSLVMELYYVVNPNHCSFPFWPTLPDTEARTVFQTAWPAHPCMVPYDVTVPSTSYGAGGYAGVVEPPQVIPHFYSTVAEKSRRSK